MVGILVLNWVGWIHGSGRRNSFVESDRLLRRVEWILGSENYPWHNKKLWEGRKRRVNANLLPLLRNSYCVATNVAAQIMSKRLEDRFRFENIRTHWQTSLGICRSCPEFHAASQAAERSRKLISNRRVVYCRMSKRCCWETHVLHNLCRFNAFN